MPSSCHLLSLPKVALCNPVPFPRLSHGTRQNVCLLYNVSNKAGSPLFRCSSTTCSFFRIGAQDFDLICLLSFWKSASDDVQMIFIPICITTLQT